MRQGARRHRAADGFAEPKIPIERTIYPSKGGSIALGHAMFGQGKARPLNRATKEIKTNEENF
jgi:hypothetical protein